MVAGQDAGGGGVNEADECASDFDQSELSAKEPGVVAPMSDEVLVFGSHVWVGKCAALGLEEGVHALVRRDHVETCK